MEGRLRYFDERLKTAGADALPGGMAHFYRSLFGYQEDEYRRYRGAALPPLGPARLPLSTAGIVVLLADEVQSLLLPSLAPLLGIVTAAQPGLITGTLEEALSRDASLRGEMLASLLGAHGEALARHAAGIRIGLEECVFILANWVRPLLAAWRNATAVPDTGSEQTRCPFCGHVAGMAIIVGGKDGGRFLRCALCGHLWRYKRIACAVCGSEDTAKLEYLSAGNVRNVRVDCCGECGGFMKTLVLDDGADPGECDTAVEDVLSAPLDGAAIARGFKRP